MAQTQLLFQTIHMTKEEFFSAYKAKSVDKPNHILLESGRGGRYSIAGLNPFAIIRGELNGIFVEDEQGEYFIKGDPLFALQEWMDPFKLPPVKDLPEFQGGAIGYISYDYARAIEKLPSYAKEDLQMPILHFLLYDEWVVFEHESNTLFVMKRGREGESNSLLDEEVKSWMHPTLPRVETSVSTASSDELVVSMGEDRFKEAVESIRTYISEGDVFQVNLSVRQSKPLETTPFSIYEELRALNPSPYMAYMATEDFQIVSASPELLVKKAGMDVSTRPIAGTRSRGRNEEEDEELANELIRNEKERAEHVMLVDLERNDLGRVCQYGSVEVDEFMVIEKYSHVMHIVSNVRGKLSENKSEVELIRAMFPGGTITGAPKIRTMEIIEELEPVRRGIYTGSIGWLGFNGDLELNIVIRTLLAKDGHAYIQSGAGVVIDSNPAHEYKEALKKAKALWKAKDAAERKEEGKVDSNDR
ncbi:anthranilate synthase component I family protein [Bacillus sp. 2205SS5-2]|uniref:anthranilate synthase component I family protein n=1 Tax=Bacillus sp. 2205SS5-2 TaxID=3109031 RepID=UPI003007D90F